MGLMVRSAALAFALFAGVVVSAGAAASGASDQAGPFEGTFEGTASGAGGTTAPMTLTLVQRGSEVTGTASLGDGLYVTSTRCGGAPVPAGTVQGAARRCRTIRATSTSRPPSASRGSPCPSR